MTTLHAFATALVAFIAMEIVANVSHRYIMHGFGWGWHRSHHEPSRGRWEKNDLYAIVFACVAIALFAIDALGFGALFWIAVGITAYGAAYALLHDVLVHQRIRARRIPHWRYLQRLIEAHRIHHATKTRDGAVSFGFLYTDQPRHLARALRELRATRTTHASGAPSAPRASRPNKSTT